MSCFKDFLIWYNNLDVAPFVKAVMKLQDFYKVKRIDIFKSSISVPGIARQLVFQSAEKNGAYFSLIDQKNSDLYFSYLQNIIGGASIIFHRQAQRDKTFIRGGNNRVKRIIGYDANALYLYAFSKEFPVGSFIRRHAKDEFKPVVRDRYDNMFYWMDYLSHKRNLKIWHKRNGNKEKRDGRFFADGVSCSNNITKIYQYDGCYFHHHGGDCPLMNKNLSEKEKKKGLLAQKRRQDRNNYYKKLGYEVEEIWECKFLKMIKDTPDLQKFVENQRPKFFKKHKKTLTEKEILEAVKRDDLFGMVEVDIAVTKKWGQGFKQPDNLTPYEYFSEMSPIFCTTDIPFEVIGEHMQNFARDSGMNTKPRRLLVGGMKARKMLFATPLLKWYLEHGLVVSKIHQVIEYNRMKCFQEFVSDVTEARRAGDRDPDLSIIADLSKLIGNSAYGSTILNKLKQSDVRYVEGENEACLKANEKGFKSMTQLSDDYEFYEIESQKNKIKLDLPIQIGFFILQYAKLRMLEFYYDFLCKYVPRDKFQMLQMDTDSNYFSIAGETLQDVIKPELLDEYKHKLNGYCSVRDVDAETHWFPRTCCPEHTKYDNRCPGLFKREYEGEIFYGLCSKTYIVADKDHCKFSSKGISKNRVKNPLEIFKSVLETKESRSSTNVGFISKSNTIFTYQQNRAGFAYFYPKREVLADGISTKPLDIILEPIRTKYFR